MNRRLFHTEIIKGMGTAAATAAGVAVLLRAAPAAEAADEWCDIDPPVIIRTPKGRLVTVYALIGAQGLLAALLNELAAVSYTVASANNGTATLVTLKATVHKTLLTGSCPTRVKVTSGLLGLGTSYGEATGTAGTSMTVKFLLNVP